jgi:hypothetical protein
MSALDQQQQLLQNKLQDLQQKKRCMDQLLAQLESLRSQRLHAMNNGTCCAPPSIDLNGLIQTVVVVNDH